MSKTKDTDRRIERFCLELVKPDMTQAQAFRNAFPKSKKWKDESVWVKASQLASTDKVRTRVQELLRKVTADGIMDLQETLLMISRVARSDVRRCFKEDGTALLPHEIDDVTAAGLNGIEVVEEFSGRGENRESIGYTKKFKMLNRNEALEKLMKHHGGYERDNKQKTDPVVALIESIAANGKLVGPAARTGA